jgi:hypothetical protein
MKWIDVKFENVVLKVVTADQLVPLLKKIVTEVVPPLFSHATAIYTPAPGDVAIVSGEPVTLPTVVGLVENVAASVLPV